MPKTPKRINLKGPGRCVFCGGRPLTKQHVFGDRMRKLFISPANVRRQDQSYQRDFRPVHREKLNSKINQGAFFTRKVRVVCLRCNTGWMRLLEERAFPIITGLIQGRSMTLSSDDQAAIAGWITQVTMTAEFFLPDGIHTPQSVRSEFMQTKIPPESWQIWIGTYGGGFFRQTALHYASERTDVRLFDKPEILGSGGFHTTMFWIGALFAHAFYSGVPGIKLSIPETGFVQIAPATYNEVRWPFSPFLDGNVRDVIEDVRKFHGNSIRFY